MRDRVGSTRALPPLPTQGNDTVLVDDAQSVTPNDDETMSSLSNNKSDTGPGTVSSFTTALTSLSEMMEEQGTTTDSSAADDHFSFYPNREGSIGHLLTDDLIPSPDHNDIIEYCFDK